MLHLKLKSLNVANVFKCADTDDRMYLHAFILNKFDSEWLISISTDSYELGLCRLESIRINVCRTGVFNMFMSIPNGFKLQHHPDKLVLPFCTFLKTFFKPVLETGLFDLLTVQNKKIYIFAYLPTRLL